MKLKKTAPAQLVQQPAKENLLETIKNRINHVKKTHTHTQEQEEIGTQSMIKLRKQEAISRFIH